MKFFMFILLSCSTTYAASGEYVCRTACGTNKPDDGYCDAFSSAASEDVQKVLNSLKCDTNKPFNLSIQKHDSAVDYQIVCCVQK